MVGYIYRGAVKIGPLPHINTIGINIGKESLNLGIPFIGIRIIPLRRDTNNIGIPPRGISLGNPIYDLSYSTPLSIDTTKNELYH